MIITVPDIHLVKGELLTSDGKGEYMKIHEQQGTMDGACSVYSVAMSLLYENIISYDDVEQPGRSNGARLLKDLVSNYGLIKKGFKLYNLTSIIKSYSTKNWSVEYNVGTPKECVEGICEEIKNGYAPIVGIGYTGTDKGHALLAVGYEKSEKISKIFCLDPGAPTPKTSIWNSYIDVHNLKQSSIYVNDLSMLVVCDLVRVEEYFVIKNHLDIAITLP